MSEADPIVRPVCNARTPSLGPLAVMVASQADVAVLQERLSLPEQRQLYMSRLYYDTANPQVPTLIGPVMGAPYAAMLLEILHAWGVQKVFFFGWCGSIDSRVRTGDIIVPSGALIDEGTSGHYQQRGDLPVQPDADLDICLQEALQQRQVAFQRGLVWTTDAIFRETRAKIQAFQDQGAIAVDMELSALLSVAVFHAVALAGVLVVSDELFTFCWQPGFKNSTFRQMRRLVSEVLIDLVGSMHHG